VNPFVLNRGPGSRTRPLPMAPAAPRDEPSGATCATCDRGYLELCLRLRIATSVTRLILERQHGHMFLPLADHDRPLVWAVHCDDCHKVGVR